MDIGPRVRQEDCLVAAGRVFQKPMLDYSNSVSQDRLVLAVCDGMGGHPDGHKASRFVCEQLTENINREEISEAGIHKALNKIQAQSCLKLPARCGTTVAGIAVHRKRAMIFNTGDSRVYRFTPQKIEYVSHDHSFVQDLVDNKMVSSEDAFDHPLKNLISFGIGPSFEDAWSLYSVYIHEDIPLSGETTYLICSDGVSDLIRDHEIYDLLCENPLENGKRFMGHLKERALKDNTSFIIAAFSED